MEFFIFITVISVVGYFLFEKKDAAPEQKGSDTFGDARFADVFKDASELKEVLAPKGVFLGVMLTEGETEAGDALTPLHYGGPRHLITVAPNRTGKGTCAIVPNLLTLEHSVIVIDPKGENAAITARRRRDFGPVYLLNPFNEHGLGSASFNPLAHLSIDSPNLVADVRGLAEALIIGDSTQTYFSDTARTLVNVIMLHLVATKGGKATLPELRRLLTLPRGVEEDGADDEFRALMFDMVESPHPFIRQAAAQFERETKSIADVISTARTQTAFLDDPAITRVLSGSDFNMLDLKARPASVYIILPSRFLNAYSRFFRLLVVSAIDQLQSRPGGVQTTMILDEFAALGHLSAIETAFGQAAGFKLQLWPFLQDLNQLHSIYKDRWESFIANAGVVQWFTPNDMFTAEYLSKRLGDVTVTTRSGSYGTNPGGASTSQSYGETGRRFHSAVELMGMREFLALITLSGLKNPIRAWRLPYYGKIKEGPQYDVLRKTYAQFQGLYDRNPFHGDARDMGGVKELRGGGAAATVGTADRLIDLVTGQPDPTGRFWLPELTPNDKKEEELGYSVGAPGEEWDLALKEGGSQPGVLWSISWWEPITFARNGQPLPCVRNVFVELGTDNGELMFGVTMSYADDKGGTIMMPLRFVSGYELVRFADAGPIPTEFYPAGPTMPPAPDDWVILLRRTDNLAAPISLTSGGADYAVRIMNKLSAAFNRVRASAGQGR